MNAPIPRKVGFLEPDLSLICKILEEIDKVELVIFTLKVKVESSAYLLTYKAAVRRFVEAFSSVWIHVMNTFIGVWHQSSTAAAADQVTTISFILWGKSLMHFKSALDDLSVDALGAEVPKIIIHSNTNNIPYLAYWI